MLTVNHAVSNLVQKGLEAHEKEVHENGNYSKIIIKENDLNFVNNMECDENEKDMQKNDLKSKENHVSEIEETPNNVNFENDISSQENVTPEDIENYSCPVRMDKNNAELENQVDKLFELDDSNEEIRLECDNCHKKFLTPR